MKILKRIVSTVPASVLVLSSLMTMSFASVAHAATNTCTWTGASSSTFNTAGNWTNCGGTTPQTGDNLVFDVSTITSANASSYVWTLNNDITSLSVGSITFQGTSSNYYKYDITGNPITLSGGITETSNTYNTIATNLTLGASQTFSTTEVLNIGDSTAQTPATLSLGSYTLTTTTSGTNCGSGINIYDTVSGSGKITNSAASLSLNTDNTGFTGTITNSAGILAANSSQALGASTAATTVSSGGELYLGFGNSNVTYANPVTLSGTGVSSTYPTIMTGSTYRAQGCGGGGGGGTESSATATLSGNVTLGSDIVFGGNDSDRNLAITGAISGAYKLSVMAGSAATLTVNSSSNQSSTSNGTISAPATTVTVQSGDNQPNQAVNVGNNVTEVIDGQRGDVTVLNGGLLKGDGQVNTLYADQGGIVAPGHSPGTLTVVKTLDLLSGSTYQSELKDTKAGDYDQIVVGSASDTTGNDVILGDTVNKAYPTLDVVLYSGANIKAGDTFTIINNLSKTAVLGQFANLPEGTTFKVGNGTMKITYKGGDGNDVVLTAMSTITAPDTGLAIVSAHPLVTLGASILAAGAIVGLTRKSNRKTAHAKSGRR